MGTGSRIALGLFLALIAQFLAFLLAGSGHGWVAPFLLSFALWVFLPITLALAWPIGPGSPRALTPILVLALVADAMLINRSIGEAAYISQYININGWAGLLIIGLWLCLWLFWQAILGWSLVAGSRVAKDANA
jgi:hypothetical protein